MNLGILWHGDFTITVHDTDCRDFHKPRKERSSGLESGIIIGCTALLDKKIHKNFSVKFKSVGRRKPSSMPR